MFANWRHQPKVNNISTILSDTRLKPFPQFLHPNPSENPAAPPMSSSNLEQCPFLGWVFLPPNAVADKFSPLQIPTDSLLNKAQWPWPGIWVLAFGSCEALSQDTPPSGFQAFADNHLRLEIFLVLQSPAQGLLPPINFPLDKSGNSSRVPFYQTISWDISPFHQEPISPLSSQWNPNN